MEKLNKISYWHIIIIIMSRTQVAVLVKCVIHFGGVRHERVGAPANAHRIDGRIDVSLHPVSSICRNELCYFYPLNMFFFSSHCRVYSVSVFSAPKMKKKTLVKMRGDTFLLLSKFISKGAGQLFI